MWLLKSVFDRLPSNSCASGARPKTLLRLLTVGALLSTRAFGAIGDTALFYDSNSNTVYGYGETIRTTEWDQIPFGNCDYYGEGAYLCYFLYYQGVSAYTELYTPSGALAWSQYNSSYNWATADIPQISGSEPGIWTAVTDHAVEWWIWSMQCIVPMFVYCDTSTQQPIGPFSDSLGQSIDQVYVPLQGQPCYGAGIDAVVMATMIPWNQLPYERSATVVCVYQFAIPSYFRDSFGEQFPPTAGDPYEPSNDPCVVYLAAPTPIAGMHSHPYFIYSDDYIRGNGCLGDQERKDTWYLESLNNANRTFSAPRPQEDPPYDQGDAYWPNTTQTSLYLLVPETDEIKRLDVGGNISTVWEE